MCRDCLPLWWSNFICFPILWRSSELYVAHNTFDKINIREVDRNLLFELYILSDHIICLSVNYQVFTKHQYQPIA